MKTIMILLMVGLLCSINNKTTTAMMHGSGCHCQACVRVFSSGVWYYVIDKSDQSPKYV